MGDEVIGDVSALQYSAALQTPANEAFVKAYRAKYGKVPSYFSESNYTTAHMIHEVMKKTQGKWPGPEQFIKMMSALTIDTPRGPVSFDDMRNPVQNIYIKKVEKKLLFGYDKPELWNTVIKTYRTSASSGPTARRNSWCSRSPAANSRPANSANSAKRPHDPRNENPGRKAGVLRWRPVFKTPIPEQRRSILRYRRAAATASGANVSRLSPMTHEPRRRPP